MPTVPISMRKLKEILRLKYGVGLSHRQIGRSLAISPSVVSRYANRAAQLGSYTWAEATWSQQLEDWVMSHVRCFQWLGGVPELVVPDNLKSATSRACKYDPDVNPTYQQMLEHYNVAVLPARPRKPKDKAKAEVGVQVVERWIMARIRHEIFYSLASLNQRIRELLERLNNKIMQKLGYSRAELFIQLDKPALQLKKWAPTLPILA